MNKLNAFSILELLAVMFIIAVLTTFGVYSISIIQRQNRDSQRVSKLSEISQEINKYRIQNLNYPTDISFTENAVIIEGEIITQLETFLSATSEDSTDSQTKYFYELEGRDYRLCVMLESGNIRGVGTLTCPDTI